MVVSVDSEKACDKIQHSFMILKELLRKLEIEEELLSLVKIY